MIQRQRLGETIPSRSHGENRETGSARACAPTEARAMVTIGAEGEALRTVGMVTTAGPVGMSCRVKAGGPRGTRIPRLLSLDRV